MIVGALCLSHSPLRDRNRPPEKKEARFNAAIASAADFVEELKPDVAIIFYPDHINGFFYRLLPPFCIGIEGHSIGDYATASGKLDIPGDLAADLAAAVLRAGVDTAISHDMQVDHGAVQPIEWLSKGSTLPAIPVFINCACPPRPTFERVRALGRAVGDWARQTSRRVLIIGSGGLSHDPPMPSLADPRPEVRERLLHGADLDHKLRFVRQNNAHLEGDAMAQGKSGLLPVNPEWDRMLLDAFSAGDLTVLDSFSDEMVTSTGGRGGHEVRSWLAALAAIGPSYKATEVYYDAIEEWLTGMGILQVTGAENP